MLSLFGKFPYTCFGHFSFSWYLRKCCPWVCVLPENKFRSLNGRPDSISVIDYLKIFTLLPGKAETKYTAANFIFINWHFHCPMWVKFWYFGNCKSTKKKVRARFSDGLCHIPERKWGHSPKVLLSHLTDIKCYIRQQHFKKFFCWLCYRICYISDISNINCYIRRSTFQIVFLKS